MPMPWRSHRARPHLDQCWKFIAAMPRKSEGGSRRKQPGYRFYSKINFRRAMEQNRVFRCCRQDGIARRSVIRSFNHRFIELKEHS
jgi:hypothetical protein